MKSMIWFCIGVTTASAIERMAPYMVWNEVEVFSFSNGRSLVWRYPIKRAHTIEESINYYVPAIEDVIIHYTGFPSEGDIYTHFEVKKRFD